MPARRSIAGIAVLGLCAVASCGGDSGSSTPTTALGDDTVTVASFDFPESVLLAEIYGQALRAKGFDVDLEPSVGPRELVQPALDRGLVEFVPEYLGTAVDFLSLGADRPTDDVGTTDAALAQVLEETRLTALAPSPAQDANAVVVTWGSVVNSRATSTWPPSSAWWVSGPPTSRGMKPRNRSP